MMLERIRAVWQEWSILIVALVVLFGGIYSGAHWSSSTNSMPATSSDQGRDRGEPFVAAAEMTPPQGGSAKQPGQQAAQSRQAPPQAPAHQENAAPAPSPSANTAAPSPPATPSPPAHDHMAASSTPSPSATTGQSPASPAPNAAPPTAPTLPTSADRTAVDGDAATGRQVYRKCQACHSLEAGKNALGPSLAEIIGGSRVRRPTIITRPR